MATETKNARDHRTLVIKNYRNFAPFCAGTKDDSEDLKEFLTLNRGLTREEIGGLVILISGNNCGKSNLLDALDKYNTQMFTDDDYTDFTFTNKVKPSIGMNVANGAYGNFRKPRKVIQYEGSPMTVLLALSLEVDSYEFYIQFLNNHQNDYYYVKEGEKSEPNPNYRRGTQVFTKVNYIQKMTSVLGQYIYDHYGSGNLNDMYYVQLLQSKKLEISDDTKLQGAITNNCTSMYENDTISVVSQGVQIDDYLFSTLERHVTSESESMYLKNKESFVNTCNLLSKLKVTNPKSYEPDGTGDGKFTQKFGYELSDNVYRYERKKIRQSDLVCKPSEPNWFILNLLKVVGYDKKALENAYAGAGNLRMKVEKEMNKALGKISDELNDLLNINEKKYQLSINLERENIEVFLTYGDDVPLNLNRQSQGFTWLFEFYFNLLKLEEFHIGDIVLLDEFGDSLSFATVKELVKKLREYAKKNGLTFVLATQNPMAIDIQHLDEVRLLIPRDDGSTHIENNFDRFGGEGNHDVIAPIIGGLTVSRNYMRSDNRKTVFVEGPTDYFYLTAFCEALRMRGKEYDIDFIPINGVGGGADRPKNVVSQILSIERNPTIFTDSDYAGMEFKKAAEAKRIKPSSIAEILGDGKKVIEDVFSATDAEKLGIKTKEGDSNKKFDHAACLSYKIPLLYDELDVETKSNFEKIIDYVMDQ